MYKLLTPEGIQRVKEEYNRRRLIVVLTAIILVLLVAIVGTLPSYVLSTIREIEVEEKSRVTETAEVSGDEAELEEWLKETNAALEVLSATSLEPKPSLYIEKVVSERGSGLYLTNFSWRKDKDSKITLIVRGIASTRQALIAFRDNLDALEEFSLVELPLSDLALSKDINFQIILTPALNQND